jgi:Fur family transcriptional regulator, peroxide stress response regulator
LTEFYIYDDMNRVHAKKSNCTSDAKDVRTALEQSGWRFTRQRAAVYEYLCAAGSHPTAEEVYAAVRPRMPKISLATVYKALEALVDSHLANKLADSDGPARYDCHGEPHYHVRDTRTGQVRDLDTSYDPRLIDKLDPTLMERLRRDGFQVTGYRLEVLGHSSHR